MLAHALRLWTIASSVLLLVVFTPASLQAQASSTITVSPFRFEMLGNPGDTITEKIKVANGSSTEVTYQTLVEDFVAEGEEGDVSLIDDPEFSNETISLAKWISVEPTRFTVPANSDRIITFSVKIPRGAEPGGKYASVLIKRGGDAVQGGASVDSRIGSLILLRVTGNVTEKLSLESFKSDNDYYQKGPVILSLRTKNEGNVHVAPKGTIIITDTFGRKVKELPLTPANVLPNSARIARTQLEQAGLIGRYTASLVATYGQNNQTISASTSFVVLPISVIVAIGGAILLLLIFVTQRRGIKRMINRLTSD